MRKRLLVLFGLVGLVIIGLLIAVPSYLAGNRVQAAVDIFASPVHAGCYIAGPSDCRIHVEPFTINLASGKKMVFFALVAIQFPGGIQTKIYDWRPDQSNPVPSIGTTYTPSLVAQDFAATCGKNYEISLQGQDSGDAGPFNLGLTGQFTCPSGMP
jgi:hypothetical protein